jgi:hypothetical protein
MDDALVLRSEKYDLTDGLGTIQLIIINMHPASIDNHEVD